MDLYLLDVTSYTDVDISVMPVIDYASQYGNIKPVGNRNKYVKNDSKAPLGEFYGQSVNVVLDDDAYDAIMSLKKGTINYNIEIYDVEYDIPDITDKHHELFIGMSHISDAISQNRAEMEDYYRINEVRKPWKGQVFNPKSIITVIMTPGIRQVVKKNTDVGFDKQMIYVRDLVSAISDDLLSLMMDTLFSKPNLSDKDRSPYSVAKIAAAVAMKSKILVLGALGDLLYKHMQPNVLYPIDKLIYELNMVVVSQVLDNIHYFNGFHRANVSLQTYVGNMLLEKLNSGKLKQMVIDYVGSTMPSALLSDIDAVVKNLDAKPLVSYYAAGLMVADKLADDLVKAGNEAINGSGRTIESYYSNIYNGLYNVTYKTIYEYVETIYPYQETPLNAKMITMVREDLDKKLKVVVNAGILNDGDYQIDFYISNDTYSISYGFINFKQNVSTLQVGLTKAILEDMFWTLPHADFKPILTNINKLKMR